MEKHLERLNSSGSSWDYQSCLSSQSSLASLPSLNSRNYHSAPAPLLLATLQPHANGATTSSLTVSGKFLYTGSSDTAIASFHRTTTAAAAATNAGKGAVKSLVIHSDKLFTAHQDNKIRVWKITTTHPHQQQHKYIHLATLPTLGDRVTKLLLPNNRIQIRRHKTSTWVHHVDAVSSLALSHDGALLYSVSWDRTIKVWRTKDFTCLESVTNAHEDAVNSVAVSHDGHVYTGSTDKRIKVWRDLGEKRKKHKKRLPVITLEKHKSGINALALSMDGSVLYSGACDRSILVWEKVEEEMGVVGAIRGHSKSILCLVVVSDLVCSGSEDKTVRVWKTVSALKNHDNNRREYYCVAVLEGHRGPVKCVAAVLDGGDCGGEEEDDQGAVVVYSGGLDCDIKVWRVAVSSSCINSYVATLVP